MTMNVLCFMPWWRSLSRRWEKGSIILFHRLYPLATAKDIISSIKGDPLRLSVFLSFCPLNKTTSLSDSFPPPFQSPNPLQSAPWAGHPDHFLFDPDPVVSELQCLLSPD